MQNLVFGLMRKPSIVVILFCLLSSFAFSQKESTITCTNVDIVKNIVFATYEKDTLLLDLYRPAIFKGNLQTIVVIRGGGFKVGDKNGFAPISEKLAKRGFAAVCIEYRTAKEALFPGAVIDAKAAVQWVNENAKEYRLDANAIGVLGGSAGAHLAMMLATTNEISALNPVGNYSDFKVNAAVILAADADFSLVQESKPLADWLGASYSENKDLWKLASPYFHINKKSAPMLFIHSSADNIVPFTQSVNSVAKLSEFGVYCELVSLPRAPHGFWHNKELGLLSIDKAALFFKEQMKQE
ncbi:alpha/beta hydrolase [uncultured Maribacter sp.]|uniref:alpha/beta hydrolase n=1 Tax=uncultured Maribacter sp. TaxID=431308 RepID=UPI00263128A9|nr:alpha/beta hydrolase [uncultured Maribacter sp.]